MDQRICRAQNWGQNRIVRVSHVTNIQMNQNCRMQDQVPQRMYRKS